MSACNVLAVAMVALCTMASDIARSAEHTAPACTFTTTATGDSQTLQLTVEAQCRPHITRMELIVSQDVV